MKKIITIVLALCLLVICAPVGICAGSAQSYVAIGDSIAAGYALEGYNGVGSTPAGSYPSLLTKKLTNTVLTDLSVSGMDSKGLLDALATDRYQAAVKGADIITVTIGSNDILIPGGKLIINSLGITDISDSEKLKADIAQKLGGDSQTLLTKLSDMYTYLKSTDATAVLDKSCATFEGNWTKIVNQLTALNPKAKIVVTGYYNPYKALDIKAFGYSIEIGTFIQGYIDRLYKVITTSELNGKTYQIADIGDITTNVHINMLDIKTSNIDPHPNAAGHTTIANRIYTLLKVGEISVTSQNLCVDGKAVETEVYNINDSNYFKLRDIAYMLNGTDAQFSVNYDEANDMIVIKTGEAYMPNGNEMQNGTDNSSTARVSSQGLMVNGVKVEISSYNIGEYNFFKLRDLGRALNFKVDYDSITRTMLINSK